MKINEQKIFFQEIPGGTSRNIHGIFLDLELRKLSVGVFYSGTFIGSSFKDDKTIFEGKNRVVIVIDITSRDYQ